MITNTRDADGVLTMTWDLPGRSQNVFNTASMAAFAEALAEAIADEQAVGIIVASAKQTFIAGADLDMLGDLTASGKTATELTASAGALSALLRRLETCGKPVVAAINGTALGGGFELALACHHRILADHPAIKVGLPEATLGLLPGAGGTQRLPRLIGVQASLGLLMEGEQLRPDKALKAGIVDEVVPAAELLDRAKAWILANPTASVQPWDSKGFKVPGGGMDEGSTLQTLMVANAMYAAKTYGNYPAGRAIMSCLFEGLRTTLDAGLIIERRYMVDLLLDPTAGAMIRTLFLSLGDANKLVRRPAGFAPRPPNTIGILGAGLMGAGIGLVAARRGIDVVILDQTADKAAWAITYATERLDKDIARKRCTEEKKAGTLSHIRTTADYADLAGCDLVIEAVFEDRDVKAAVTKAAEAVISTDAVFGTNTSTLPITGLAEASSRPARFIGLHFFSPVERMQLVEVIRGAETSDETLAWALDAIKALGKTPIVVNDARGFYTSRVFGTYITEGSAMLAEGILPALIENAGKASGMPMPPLQLADEVGLGLMYQVGIQTKKDLGDAAPANPSQPILEELVTKHDRTGKRCGRGFYDYSEGGKRLWPGLGGLFAAKAEQPTVEDLVERYLYTQALEAARCMDQGILLAAADADVGAVMGWGFAPWSGGPLSYIDRIGPAAFVARSDELAAALGERFEPPALLRTMAKEGTTFYG